MAEVYLKNIRKEFDNSFVAIHDMNLKINNKEFLVLVGPSGCGKSTTLRMIAGLEEISGGDIYIEDRLVSDLLPKDRNIAMVFQDYALYPHMTVFNNIAFGLKMRKVPKDKIRISVEDAALRLGLTDILDRKPRQLSGGQRQRVALGRAIVRNPEVFLFDEPLSNLDAKLRGKMRIELKKLHEQLEATIIYVTHDQVEAMTLGTRIVVMNKGYVQQVGRPLELYNSPSNKFVAGFIGSPPMNFFPCEFSEENNALVIKPSGLKISISQDQIKSIKKCSSKNFFLGIRPEDMEISKKKSNNCRVNNKIRATVQVVEILGKHANVEMSFGNYNLCASTDKPNEICSGEELYVYFKPNRMHLFLSEGTQGRIF